MSDVLVRPAAAADVEAVEALGRRVAAQPLLLRYGATPEGLGGDLRLLALGQAPRRGGPGRLLLAEATGGAPALCGFARFQVEGSLGAGGYLQLIALAPGSEGRGAGTALLLAVEAEVRAASPVLFLLTSDFNDGAQRFYERHGYHRAGPLPAYARPDITEYLYWKRLRP